MKYTFPEGFLWGASISSYQTEGNNTASDWYAWERDKGLVSSGEACRHYHLYKEDFSLAKRLSCKALRFSLEWSRIEPEPGKFSQKELTHYRNQLLFLKQLGIVPVLTLHHFTNPIWFARLGGWSKTENIDFFLRYVAKVCDFLADQLVYVLVINEPMVYIYNGFIQGIWPPGKKSMSEARLALDNMLTAYIYAYQELKNRSAGPELQVSLAKNLIWFTACSRANYGQNYFYAFLRNSLFNKLVLKRLFSRKVLDFIGVNYYSRQYLRSGGGLLGKECNCSLHREHRNYLGWYMSPEGFLAVLRSLKPYHLPVLITENGTAEKNYEEYEQFLCKHLKVLARAIGEGLDCRGYLWWSLLDNFEWDKGFGPRFGLAEVDYETYSRSLKPFALRYKEIIDNNAFTC